MAKNPVSNSSATIVNGVVHDKNANAKNAICFYMKSTSKSLVMPQILVEM